MKISRIGLKGRLLLLSAVSIALVALSFSVAAYWVIAKDFTKRSATEVATRSSAISDLFLQDTLRFSDTARLIAGDEALGALLVRADAAALGQRLDSLVKDDSSDFAFVVDAKGSPAGQAKMKKTAGQPASLASVRLGLAGKASSGFEHLEEGLALLSASPVLKDGAVVGVVVVGSFFGSHGFVDRVKNIYDVECTIFDGDTRASTTILRDGKRLVGTKMDNPVVLETVLRDGNSFTKRNLIAGNEYDTAYWPLLSPEGKAAGMGFIGRACAEERATYLRLFTLLALVIAIAGALVMVGVFLISSRLAGDFHSLAESILVGSKEVSSASQQVSVASQALASASSEQASSLEEASASLEEMSGMTSRNAESASLASGLARQTRQSAELGATEMDAMRGAMDAIKSSSDDIAKIIKTIDEIAFQTNILALNAAVEAARAGEAGAGFAVVAEEVRGLAQRSAEAARETSSQISAAIGRTDQGVAISEKVAGTLKEIVESVRKVDELVQEVSSASKEQSQGITQLNQAVSKMDQIVQQNAASSEETAAAANELNGQAGGLKETVGGLLSLVDGRKLASKEME